MIKFGSRTPDTEWGTIKKIETLRAITKNSTLFYTFRLY